MKDWGRESGKVGDNGEKAASMGAEFKRQNDIISIGGFDSQFMNLAF